MTQNHRKEKITYIKIFCGVLWLLPVGVVRKKFILCAV